MNLDNLKPAWQQFKVVNSMQAVDRNEILAVLAQSEGVVFSRTNRVLIHTILFLVLTFCFQAG